MKYSLEEELTLCAPQNNAMSARRFLPLGDIIAGCCCVACGVVGAMAPTNSSMAPVMVRTRKSKGCSMTSDRLHFPAAAPNPDLTVNVLKAAPVYSAGGQHADTKRTGEAFNSGVPLALYSRHNDRALRFIARFVTDASRAEDLVSEVLIDVWSQADPFEGRSQVLTWILSIARHKALSALLAQRRRRVAELDDAVMEMIVDPVDMPEQRLLNQDCGAQLRTCLAQMSREHREIIDLVYYAHGIGEPVSKFSAKVYREFGHRLGV
jgi:RNA polymerase sigma factor (sigma-70 family)